MNDGSMCKGKSLAQTADECKDKVVAAPVAEPIATAERKSVSAASHF